MMRRFPPLRAESETFAIDMVHQRIVSIVILTLSCVVGEESLLSLSEGLSFSEGTGEALTAFPVSIRGEGESTPLVMLLR